MKTIDTFDATASGAVVGRHSIWAPALQLKIPFQFAGQVTKYHHAEAGYDPAATLPQELAILHALATEGMAPPIGDLVRIETLISEHPGAWWADPVGAWAYEMADATRLPPGRFSLERMQRLPIVGSPGAWGDIAKPGNVVNGYLVDVRRSAWDMLRLDGPVAPLPRVEQDLEALRARVHRDCQFPPGERAEAYQDFWIGGELARGQRRVVERAQAMGFNPMPGETVLDIGCQSGGFLQLAARAGARAVGVEVDPGYVDCARALARSCRQNISIRRMDVVQQRDAFIAWVRACYPGGVDHLLLCSMEKHLGENSMFEFVDAIGARCTYIETNAVAADKGEGPEPAGSMKLWPLVAARAGRHVGNTRDRNLRRLYQIEGGIR
jgi:SAM-dependent methyltransferase